MSRALAPPGRLPVTFFAYLRAVSEGVPIAEAALRYLGIEHRAEAPAAHGTVTDQVRAIARRRGDPRWRLVGIEIAAGDPNPSPSIDEWAEAEGLADWSHAELQDLYAERFGQADPLARRRQARNTRLRERRLQLLQELEATTSQPASPTDLLDGWVPSALAEQLRKIGMLTLADLQQRVDRGGRWWLGVKGFGPTKAARLTTFLRTVLPSPTPAPGWTLARVELELTSFSGANGLNRAIGAYAGTDARNDHEAVQRWVAARATSDETKKQYTRQAERFILWCVLERRKAMSDATAEDCSAYMEFLADVPSTWMSKRSAARHEHGWAPFKGPLTLASQKLALAALHSLFSWLVQAGYLASNPWVLVNRKLGDDPRHTHVDADAFSRAFTRTAWAALQAYLRKAPSTPSLERNRWLCIFAEGTGLRSAELLRATLGDMRRLPAGWVIRVHGKGRRNRVVPVPQAAFNATTAYLASRGLELDKAPAETPLLASLENGSPITYSALYQSFTRFVRAASHTLPIAERERAERASAHWLRHTHGTRAAEGKVPQDVLQENLGQSDPRTTAIYYRAQIERRQQAMEATFSEGAND